MSFFCTKKEKVHNGIAFRCVLYNQVEKESEGGNQKTVIRVLSHGV